MDVVPSLQQHQTLLRVLSAALADGVADNGLCQHLDTVFATLTGAKYKGLEIALDTGDHIALFHHTHEGCGSFTVHKINPANKKDMPIAICVSPVEWLLRIPVLCSHESMCALTSAQDCFAAWIEQAAAAPIVGSLLVAVNSSQAASHIQHVDKYTANMLLLATMLGPMLIERAEARLLQVATATGVVLHQGGGVHNKIAYVPGRGFVCTGEDNAEEHDKVEHNSVAVQLLDMLLETRVWNSGERSVQQEVWQVVDDGAGDTTSSSDSSAPSVHGSLQDEEEVGLEQQQNQEEEEQVGGTRLRGPKEPKEPKGPKRQRCVDDASSSIGHDEDYDDDDVDNNGHDHSFSKGTTDSTGGASQAANSSSSNNNNSKSAGGTGVHKRSKAENRCRTSTQEGGLVYADAQQEGRFVMYMQRDMAQIKLLVLLCVLVALAGKCAHEFNSDHALLMMLPLVTILLLCGVLMLPLTSARWARTREGMMVALALTLGCVNIALFTRYWLAVVQGSTHLVRTMPLFTIAAGFGDGCILQLMRSQWVYRVTAAKQATILCCLAWALCNGVLPWWAVVIVCGVGCVFSAVAACARAMEVEQRLRFRAVIE